MIVVIVMTSSTVCLRSQLVTRQSQAWVGITNGTQEQQINCDGGCKILKMFLFKKAWKVCVQSGVTCHNQYSFTLDKKHMALCVDSSQAKITERNTRPTAFNSHCYSTESLSCTGQRLTRLPMLTKADPSSQLLKADQSILIVKG